MVYKINYLDNTSDFVTPHDFDDVEVINKNCWLLQAKMMCVMQFENHC